MYDISVVIATYNGSKYILEQLESIRMQTVKADQVIILDDKSSDDTARIIRQYIIENELKGWKLIVNTNNLGWEKNFKKGFDLCSGEYIFPCDQDDIWHKNKIEKMIMAMETNENILLLSSNYHIFACDGGKVEPWYRDRVCKKNHGEIRKQEFDEKWVYVIRPGCSYCFRHSLLDRIEKNWDYNIAHDAQLWWWAHLYNGNYRIEEELMDYRRHGNNVTSKIDMSRKTRIEKIKLHSRIVDYMLNWKMHNLSHKSDSVIEILRRNSDFYKFRSKCVIDRKLYIWLILVTKYRKFYISKKGCLLDLLCTIRR